MKPNIYNNTFIGDRLLPLSADVEVSDFPTLDEVQQMAIEGAKHAHGNRSKNIPSTSNAIRRQADEVSSKFQITMKHSDWLISD